MKSSSFSTARLAFVALMLTFSTIAFSQKTIVWKGGTPGKANDWNCPRNWSTYHVPDEFSNVVVPNVSTSTQASPVIASGMVEVNSLYIESNASLTLGDTAQLVIFDKAGSHIPNRLHLKGTIFFFDETEKKVAKGVTAANF